MSEKVPTKTEILGVVQAQSDTLQEISERIVKLESISSRIEKLEGQTDKQENRNQNTLYAVLIASLFIVVTVAVSVILTNRDNQSISEMTAEKIRIMENSNLEKIQKTDEQINLLKARNPYLK